jgi:tetratricopeptide (TPR) repeat protein
MSERVRLSVAQRSIAQNIVIAAVILIAFGRIASHGWVNFDDPIHVTENPSFFPLSWRELGGFWVHPYEHLYVPASYMLFAGESAASRWLYGDGPMAVPRPGLFHAVSLALHVAASLLVLRILRRFTTQPWAAVVGGLVFALHPLQVESVAWVAEQRGLLAAVFSLLAIDQFLEWTERDQGRSRLRASYVLATGALVVALLAKPSAVVTPLLAFTLASHDRKVPRPTLIWALAPWIVLAVAAAVCTRFVQPADLTRVHAPLMTRPLIAGDAIAFYAGKLLVPVNLCVVYGRTPQATLADPYAPFAAVLVAIAIAWVLLLPRGREWRLPLALFVIPLVPVLGFTDFAYQNNSTVADRYMYLALLGPAVAVAMAIDRLQAVKGARPGGSPPLAAGILVALLCLLLTWQQVGLWRDSLTLFTSSLKSGHESSVALNNLGIALTEAGLPDDALPLLLRAVERDPTDAGGWFNLGNSHAAADEFTEAGQAFDRCLALDGERFKAWNNLGLARLFQGDAAGALAAWLESIRIRPQFADARLNLAKLLLSRGESEAAAEHVQTVLERDRTHAEAHNMLGVIHAEAGRPREAAACFEAAVRFAARREDFRANLERARQALAAGQSP